MPVARKDGRLDVRTIYYSTKLHKMERHSADKPVLVRLVCSTKNADPYTIAELVKDESVMRRVTSNSMSNKITVHPNTTNIIVSAL